jgi:uncharacterized membrane protein
MKFLHIITGISALVSGAIALYAAKGGKLHRKSEMFFVFTQRRSASCFVCEKCRHKTKFCGIVVAFSCLIENFCPELIQKIFKGVVFSLPEGKRE